MSEENKVSLDQRQPQQNVQPGPGESGYVPPVDAVPLPSEGKIYSVDSPLFQAKSVEIKSMTAKEEDILSSRALLKSGKALNTLIKACVVDKTIDTEQMLSGDRNAILIAIRITGYGSDYEVTIQCDDCNEKYKHNFDLRSLKIKPLGAEPIQPGVNAFEFPLPVTKKRCIFKLLSGIDERDLSAMQDGLKKTLGVGGNDASVTMRLFFNIIQIGEEKNRGKLQEIIRNLPALDSRKLRKYIDDISPGIDMEQEVTCPHCGEKKGVTVPFGTEFFWPQS